MFITLFCNCWFSCLPWKWRKRPCSHLCVSSADIAPGFLHGIFVIQELPKTTQYNMSLELTESVRRLHWVMVHYSERMQIQISNGKTCIGQRTGRISCCALLAQTCRQRLFSQQWRVMMHMDTADQEAHPKLGVQRFYWTWVPQTWLTICMADLRLKFLWRWS